MNQAQACLLFLGINNYIAFIKIEDVIENLRSLKLPITTPKYNLFCKISKNVGSCTRATLSLVFDILFSIETKTKE